MLEHVHTDLAPKAIGPYSQAIKANGFLFISGQTPISPKTGKINGETIEEQAEQSIQNIGAILKSQGVDFGQVVKTTCFLADMKYFAAFNQVYASHFVSKPARSCFAVKELPMNVLCEVEVIAAL